MESNSISSSKNAFPVILFPKAITLLKFPLAKITETQTAVSVVIVASIISFLYLIFTEKKQTLTALKLDFKQILVVIYLGALGTALTYFLYYAALTKIPALNVVLIAHTQTIFILLMGYFFLRHEKVTFFDGIGMILMFLAALFVSTGTIENLLNLKFGTVYEILVLVSVIIWAAASIIVKKWAADKPSGVLTFYRSFIAAIIFSAWLIFNEGFKFGSIWQIIIGITDAVGYIFYYEGLKRIKAAQVSSLELAAPFFTAVLGFIVLGEQVLSLQIVGLLILLVGIYFLSKHDNTN